MRYRVEQREFSFEYDTGTKLVEHNDTWEELTGDGRRVWEVVAHVIELPDEVPTYVLYRESSGFQLHPADDVSEFEPIDESDSAQ